MREIAVFLMLLFFTPIGWLGMIIFAILYALVT